jgi:hypothetical protein
LVREVTEYVRPGCQGCVAFTIAEQAGTAIQSIRAPDREFAGETEERPSAGK